MRADQFKTFVIKAEVRNPRAKTFEFPAQKTMYGGKRIAKGHTVFVFASENEGGKGLVALGIVTSARAIPKKRGIERQTARVSITVRCAALAKQPLGRGNLKPFTDWSDGRAETESQFQVLSSGNQQDRRHLGENRTFSAQILLRRLGAEAGWFVHLPRSRASSTSISRNFGKFVVSQSRDSPLWLSSGGFRY